MSDEDFSKNWVWIPDEDEIFIKGYIKDYLDDKRCQVCYKKNHKEIIKTFEISKLDNCNPSKFNKCNDMAELTHLNEPSVIYNLNLRYNDDLIYTYSGLFLVAINPYKNLSIYDIKAFNYELPHIYSIANSTFKNLIKNKKNQSILVTGESGAGKTENTKKIIQYFSLNGNDKSKSKSGKSNAKEIDEKILQANPIMESFGNAKTIKNNNSSRFGKFIKIYFNSKGNLIGGNINYYLLEKSRVINQLSGERNYHIFYQFLKGYDNLSKFKLTSNLKNYKILQNSEISTDLQDFKNLLHSFEIIGMTPSMISEILNILAIILHIGNVEFSNLKSDQANFHKSSPIPTICKLLGVDQSIFEKNLLKPKVKAGKEFIERSKNPTEVKYLLDSLCKLLYENLFNFIIEKINDTLSSDRLDDENFIGVLDIAGFEIFEINTFEQLCINYTNEKLQQFFNHHSFILEQSEYLREDIKWDYIDFGQDLQPTIELIENSKPMGVLKLLDEECKIPKSSDKSFLDKLLANFDNTKIPDNNHDKFRANKFKSGFIINHYAGEVEYNVDDWLNKNNDPINEHLLEILKSSNNDFITTEMLKLNDTVKRNQSLSTKYKQQLSSLMEELNNTEPHFVRCILPNLNKKPNSFNKSLVLNQLRCNGVLEGIRITRAGYPNKMIFEDFFNRYSILNSKDTVFTKSSKTNCEMIIKSIDLLPETYKIGITKLFFKNGILGKLEELRDLQIKQIFTKLQSVIRGEISRKFYNTKINQIQNSQILAKNMVKVNELKSNLWYSLFINLKPLLEDSIKVLNSKEINDSLKTLTLKLKDSEKLNKNYEIENAQLSKTVEEFQGMIRNNDKSIKEKKELIEKLTKNEISIKGQIEALTAKLSDAETKHTVVASEKGNIAEEFETLNSKYGEFSGKYDELLTKFNELSESHDKLKSADESLKQDHQKEKSNHEKSLTLLKSQKERYDQLKLDHKTLKKNYESIEESHNKLEQKHVDNLTKIDKLKEKYHTLVKDFENLNTSNSELTKSVNSYQTVSTTSKSELTKLKGELKKLKVEKEEVLSQLSTSAQDVVALKVQITALTKENSSLSRELSKSQDVKSELADANKKIKELTSENGKHSDLVHNLNLQISNLKKDNHNLETKMAKVSLTMDHNEKSKREYSNKIVELNSTVEKLKTQIIELKNDQQKENQPPIELMQDYGNLKLKCNELAASLRSQKFENSKLSEEVNILKNKIHISPYNSPRKSYRNSMQLGEDLSIMKGNNMLISQIEDLKLKLEQEETNSTRAENYAIELQKKLNKIQNTRGLNSSIDFEKKYKDSQLRVSELEKKFEGLFEANSPSSSSISSISKSESFGRSSVINKTLENANQDFVKIYHDITKTLKTTREELTNSKSEILRLKSLLRESEDELYSVKRENFKTSVENYETEVASLKVKQDNLIQRNNDLLKSVELYKSRSDEYYKKLELSESAIKISKRHEEQSQRELMEIKNEYKLLREELKTSEVIIKKLNNEKQALETKITEKDHEISNKSGKINELNDKISYNKKVFENKELVENYKQDIQNLHNELNFKLENESKLVKENKQLKVDNEVLLQQKAMLEEDYEVKLTKLEEFENTIDDLNDQVRVLGNEKLINERKINNNNKQIQNLKQLVNDVTLQRDELLEVKDKLEEDNLILTQTIEDQKIKIQSNETNLSLLRTHLESTRLESSEIQNELNQSKLSNNDDITNYQLLKREKLVIAEENDSLKKVNKELKTKVATLEHKLYNDEQVKYWENKISGLTKKLDSVVGENFDLTKTINNYESEIKGYRIKNMNDTKLIKSYNDENFGYKSKVNQLTSDLDILHNDNLDKELKLKTLEREHGEMRNNMLLLQKEVLQLRERLN